MGKKKRPKFWKDIKQMEDTKKLIEFIVISAERLGIDVKVASNLEALIIEYLERSKEAAEHNEYMWS